MWKRLLGFSGFKLGILLTLLVCALQFYVEVFPGGDQSEGARFLHKLNNLVLDLKFNLRGGPRTEEERKAFQDRAHVVIAAIDEKSLRDLGMWPWPRRFVGTLIRNLNACGAKVIGFDVVFSEPDASRLLPLVETIEDRYRKDTSGNDAFGAYLDELKVRVDGDRALEKVLEDSENVVLGYFLFKADSRSEIEKLEPAEQKEVLVDGFDKIGFGTIGYFKKHPKTVMADKLNVAIGVRANLKQLAEAAELFGFFNAEADADGVFRTWPMLVAARRPGQKDPDKPEDLVLDVYPSLSLQVLSSYYGQPINVYLETASNTDMRLPEYLGLYIGPVGSPAGQKPDQVRSIQLESRGKFRVNFYGPSQTFRHISASDIIANKPEACQAIQGKVVLVGSTSVGVYDLRPIPLDSHYPGVEAHATVIENVISDQILIRPIDLALIELLVMFVIGLIISWLLNRLRVTLGLILTLTAMIGLAVADYYGAFGHGLLAHIVLPETQLLVLFIGVAVYRYVFEEREKSKVRQAFQFYLSKDVIDTMLQDTSKLKLGGERRELTVLFSDIRGFTTISEKLDPTALTELLNEYLTPMTEIVFNYRGTLDKYMGDAIMAIFGAPLPFDDHPRAACRAALDMMEELARLRQGWHARGLPELDIGIGVNTGIMSVGNMGSARRFDYTVLGDNVNLGSRLEGLNKGFGSHIIISEFTRHAIGDHFTCRELDLVAVKGKIEPVRIFELVHSGPPKPEQDGWIGAFEMALQAYRRQAWDEALAGFEHLVADRADPASRVYIGRCRDMQANPPGAGWDGVFKMKTK